ncbi:hypothetical protein BFF78_25040 [Streptomyces fodineus]|uniref:Uncharacterized protein n=1 Tax=Streptomyces fodineus TaxID=1904616 RepID=A0A1D7YE36_9ACTN|nr:hypothetical protein BFF78_25040 [Streptomyces fodineus]
MPSAARALTLALSRAVPRRRRLPRFRALTSDGRPPRTSALLVAGFAGRTPLPVRAVRIVARILRAACGVLLLPARVAVPVGRALLSARAVRTVARPLRAVCGVLLLPARVASPAARAPLPARAVLPGALCLCAVLGAAASASAASAAPAGWSVAPAGGGRPSFYAEGTPGTVLQDTVSVTNPGRAPVVVRLSGAGLRTAFAGKAQQGIRVPARTRAEVPFTVTVPDGAAPGDRSGALVARDTRGRTVTVPIRLRVGGPALAALTVEHLAVHAERITYELVNRGTTVLVPRLAVRADGVFGRVLDRAPRTLPVHLRPGARLKLAEPWSDRPALDAVDVRLTVTAPGGAHDTATTSARFVPWGAVAGTGGAALAGTGALLIARRRRHRSPSTAPAPSGSASNGPTPSGSMLSGSASGGSALGGSAARGSVPVDPLSGTLAVGAREAGGPATCTLAAAARKACGPASGALMTNRGGSASGGPAPGGPASRGSTPDDSPPHSRPPNSPPTGPPTVGAPKASGLTRGSPPAGVSKAGSPTSGSPMSGSPTSGSPPAGTRKANRPAVDVQVSGGPLGADGRQAPRAGGELTEGGVVK